MLHAYSLYYLRTGSQTLSVSQSKVCVRFSCRLIQTRSPQFVTHAWHIGLPVHVLWRRYPALLAFCNGDESSMQRYASEFKSAPISSFLDQFSGGQKCNSSKVSAWHTAVLFAMLTLFEHPVNTVAIMLHVCVRVF